MSDTTFANGTVITSDWLNDVNSSVYGLVSNVQTLRTLDKTRFSFAETRGYYTVGDGGGAKYYLDSSDVSSTDNGGSIIVGADGGVWKLVYPQVITPEIFGAIADGITSVDSQIAAAITYLASLTGSQYQDSMGQTPYGYGVSRRLLLSGKKYILSSTLTLSGDVGIYADGGGFLAGSLFPSGAYVVDTGTNPYGGRVIDLTIDGGDRNVKGILIRNANFTRWRGLSVVSCRNDGITYQSGAEFYLSDFEVSGSISPNSVNVAGLRVLGSDASFTNGVVKFTPIGVYGNGGGNCEFTNIHSWGLYENYKQYVGFWFVNCVRNTITSCYIDSPAKQDYSQDNLVVLNGIPNGGVGFYLDSTSTQNSLVGCRGYVNTSAWSSYATAHSITGNHFYDVYTAAQYTNILSLVHNYVGPWAGDVRFSSNSVRDSSTVISTPTITNGLSASTIACRSDAGGSVQNLQIENTNNGFASSEARVSFVVGGSTRSFIGSVYGSSGAGTWYVNHIGANRFGVQADGTVTPGADNSQNFGSSSVRWSTIYATTGTINTSDERDKQDFSTISDKEKAVALNLKSKIKSFKFKDAVINKGENARIHFGVIAQEVAAAFEEQGLDPTQYGLFCYDEWEETPELKNDLGEIIQPHIPKGSKYGVRYEELITFILGSL